MSEAGKKLRQTILAISHKSGRGHIPTSFSVVEILLAVYETIRHKPFDPLWDGRDIFILSKGHAALAHYTVLAEHGYFPAEDIFSLGGLNSRFGCHADRLKVPGVEASTGSLGHGIGLAVGMALGAKIRMSEQKVYVLVGDGESNEGSIWEAVMVAISRSLNNLTIIYDDNRSHYRGLQITDPASHFRGFGCQIFEADGHDTFVLKDALQKTTDTVKVILAHTEKGHGCRTLVENPYEWHGKIPNDTEYAMLMEELDATAV